MGHAVIFLRRSQKGEEDKNSSIENQRQETNQLAVQKSPTIVEEYSDPGGQSPRLLLFAHRGTLSLC
jgi:hypothetical protein